MVKGVVLPARYRFRQILVTGPPGSGKSTLVTQLGGWPQEGDLDLARAGWWRERTLAFRPREVHLGLPFVGFDHGLAVFDPEFLEAPLKLDLRRIHIPPAARYWFNTDWRHRYAFDVQLPALEELLAARRARVAKGRHRRDLEVTDAQIERQLTTYAQVARHLNRCGMEVYVRTSMGGPPCSIVVD